jgi:hypothetical protein
MAEVIHMFPWAWVRRCELGEKPMCPEEILACLLADITEAHRLMLQSIPSCVKTYGDEHEWQEKARNVMSEARKHAEDLMLVLVESGLVDLEAVLKAWQKFGPTSGP